MDILDWLQDWYKDRCDGEWEHGYGIKIDTIDNPGWKLTIDLKETKLETMIIERKLIDRSDDDWHDYWIDKSQFVGHGDLSKLKVPLNLFKKIWEEN